MSLPQIYFKDLGGLEYGEAWAIQETLLQENVQIKTRLRDGESSAGPTRNHLLFVEHPPVYTLGKSGHPENILLTEIEMKAKGIGFYRSNRGGDITWHGPGQVVGYPILDLEQFTTDIGLYLRRLEEVIIRTIAGYGLKGERSAGETGVWLDPGRKGRERKIAALGVRCSRWITMHGFALNVNPDLRYFNHIIPCGIRDKAVTSIQAELGHAVDMEEVKGQLKKHFTAVFGADITTEDPGNGAAYAQKFEDVPLTDRGE